MGTEVISAMMRAAVVDSRRVVTHLPEGQLRTIFEVLCPRVMSGHLSHSLLETDYQVSLDLRLSEEEGDRLLASVLSGTDIHNEARWVDDLVAARGEYSGEILDFEGNLDN